jgi:hypothetical protein
LADVPLAAHLELVPTHTLPGIPVVFVVTITNTSNQPKELYEYARLNVTDGHGNTFAVRWGGRNDGDVLRNARAGNKTSHMSMIPAGGRATFEMPVGVELMENSAFYDSRLCQPGTYDLQMIIGQTDDVKTNNARLTVDAPRGDDLAFWKAASSAAGDAGLNLSTWQSKSWPLLAKYPQSSYYQMLAFYRVPSEKPEDIIAVMKQALADGPSEPIADEFRGQIAFSLQAEARDAAARGDFHAAEAALTEAGSLLDNMIEHGSTEYLRAKGLDLQAQLQATAAEIEAKRSHRPVKPDQPIKPIVQCRESDGRVRFGYVNPNDPLRVKVGPENRFNPEPSDRGQPVQFAAGTRKQAVSVALLSGERTLSWALDGSTVTFSLDAPSPKKCDGDDDEGGDH